MRIPDAVHALGRELQAIFGDRLRSFVVYDAVTGDDRTSTLAVVDGLSADDLYACVGRIAQWHDGGLDTPLFVAAHEFGRSLDAFPFEFGAILADHVVIAGNDPFTGLEVDRGDLRHACEVQARSQLLHLREGFLETRGRGDLLGELLLRSAAPLAALLKSVVRLEAGADAADAAAAAALIERRLSVADGALARIVGLTRRGEIPSDEARRLFPAYLDAVQKLTAYVDAWGVA